MTAIQPMIATMARSITKAATRRGMGAGLPAFSSPDRAASAVKVSPQETHLSGKGSGCSAPHPSAPVWATG